MYGTIGQVKSVWMSATLEPGWLKTIDFEPPTTADNYLRLDTSDKTLSAVRRRNEAAKHLSRAESLMGDAHALAREIVDVHEPESKTLVVINTVRRARELYYALKKLTSAKLLLVHSQFRSPERKIITDKMLAPPDSKGTIIVATQVVEAGVDFSAKTLFTELAPWASLVQRFGRCNRQGEYSDAKVRWIDWPPDEEQKNKLALPYERDSLESAQALLTDMRDVAPARLPECEMPFSTGPTLRRKDIVELFDTTPRPRWL